MVGIFAGKFERCVVKHNPTTIRNMDRVLVIEADLYATTVGSWTVLKPQRVPQEVRLSQ